MMITRLKCEVRCKTLQLYTNTNKCQKEANFFSEHLYKMQHFVMIFFL